MSTITYTLTHPHCYNLKGYTQQLRDRAETASDSTQWTAILNTWVLAAIAASTGGRYQAVNFPADPTGHTGRHLKWLLVDAINRSHDNADIKADIAALYAEIVTFPAP